MQSLYNAFPEVGRNYTKEQFDQEFRGHFLYNFFVKYEDYFSACWETFCAFVVIC